MILVNCQRWHSVELYQRRNKTKGAYTTNVPKEIDASITPLYHAGQFRGISDPSLAHVTSNLGSLSSANGSMESEMGIGGIGMQALVKGSLRRWLS